MTKVSLRAYDHEIESMIEQGQRLDEAVAHCRHILASFPKHLDTYRLLGKAYLEAKRHEQAVDVFQRVLVAAPDDFVSHVGMSIIADDQGRLDDAIWHMERAFEVQPSNAAIQAELQRLFGRRDGMEPPKIRLTRGALAHMYVQGDLYTQAISEIRAALANDPKRMDMQVLLARAYFRNGQKTEAAEVCAALLAISPYCLDANRLMAEILPGTQAAEAAQEYRRRVQELDPYAEFAKGSIFGSDAVADGAVTLERLEYTGQPSDFGAGIALGLAAGMKAALPADRPPKWIAEGVPSEPVKVAPSDAAMNLPEFLRGSGWREVPAGENDDIRAVGAAVASDEEQEAAALPGDLPEWVRALAPSDVQQAPSDPAGQAPEGSYWKLGGQPPDDSEPDQKARADDDSPGWLRELAKGTEASSSTPTPLEENLVRPRIESNAGPGSAAAVENDNGLAWLEGLAAKHGAKPEELLTPQEARTEQPPEWIDMLAQGETGAPDGWKPVDEGRPDAVLAEADRPEHAPIAGAGSSIDWLTGLVDGNAFAEMEKPSDIDQSPFGDESAASARPAPVTSDELAGWLADKPPEPGGASSSVAREPSGEFETGVDLPDWLADLDATKKPTVPAGRSSEPPRPAAARPEPSDLDQLWRPLEPDSKHAEELASAVSEPATPIPEPPVRVAEQAARGGQELPARTRPAVQAVVSDESSLRAAKTELARGNIAAALEIYGRLIRKGRSLSEIIRELREALYRYPVEVPIWQALGDAYMRANRLQEALDAYTKAEELLR